MGGAVTNLNLFYLTEVGNMAKTMASLLDRCCLMVVMIGMLLINGTRWVCAMLLIVHENLTLAVIGVGGCRPG